MHEQCLVSAPATLAFRCHAEPDLLAQWWGPAGFTVPGVELDLRRGGAYRIAMQPPDGSLFYLSGEFRDVDAPARLTYTFRWEDPHPDDRDTVVTFALHDRGASTHVTVDQGVFATEARRDLHQQGWSESLTRLQALVASIHRDS